MTKGKGSRSFTSLAQLSDFAKSFAKKKGLNADAAQDLYRVLLDAYEASRDGQLGLTRATALAMQFVGRAVQAIDEELHLP